MISTEIAAATITGIPLRELKDGSPRAGVDANQGVNPIEGVESRYYHPVGSIEVEGIPLRELKVSGVPKGHAKMGKGIPLRELKA